MSRLVSLSSARTSQALTAVLRDEGLDLRDFEAEEGAAPAIVPSSPVVGPLLRVRCLSTQRERTYSVGSGFTWLRPFLRDLHEGQFGAAVPTVSGQVNALASASARSRILPAGTRLANGPAVVISLGIS